MLCSPRSLLFLSACLFTALSITQADEADSLDQWLSRQPMPECHVLIEKLQSLKAVQRQPDRSLKDTPPMKAEDEEYRRRLVRHIEKIEDTEWKLLQKPQLNTCRTGRKSTECTRVENRMMALRTKIFDANTRLAEAGSREAQALAARLLSYTKRMSREQHHLQELGCPNALKASLPDNPEETNPALTR